MNLLLGIKNGDVIYTAAAFLQKKSKSIEV